MQKTTPKHVTTMQNETDNEDTENQQQQQELDLPGDLRGLPWAVVVLPAKRAAAAARAGTIEWRGDAYYATDAETKEHVPVQWIAAITQKLVAADLSHAEFRVLAILCYRAGAKGCAWPGRRSLMRDANMSRDGVDRAIAGLLRKGAIEKIENPRTRSNTFRVVEDWPGEQAKAETEWPGEQASDGPVSRPPWPGEQARTSKGTGTMNSLSKGGEGEGELFDAAELGIEHEHDRPGDLWMKCLPEHLRTTNVLLALGQYEADRRERKKPMSRRAVKLLCNRISDWSADDIVDAAHRAIEGGWQRLYLSRSTESDSQKPASDAGKSDKDFSSWSESTS